LSNQVTEQILNICISDANWWFGLVVTHWPRLT